VGATTNDLGENRMLIGDLTIVIPAAGLGQRLGFGPKALLQLGDSSLLQWVSRKAQTVAAEVIVAAPPDDIALWSQHCPGCRVIAGGSSHLASMTKLIEAATQPWVMNLSVSTPFVSTSLMRRVVEAARQCGIAGAFLPMDMPVAHFMDSVVSTLTPARSCAIAQGPNAFRRDHLLELIRRADTADWQRQSFLEIALHHGLMINMVVGKKDNMKITYPDDWVLAQLLQSLLY
jgi:2-C-methyl-D-erythritol 4-phosphate cytidylyltransferase